MTQETTTRADEAAIRAEIDAFAQAVRARDVDALLRHGTPDIVTFDLVPPIQHEGADAVRRNWTAVFAMFDGPAEYEVRDLAISVGGDVAFSRGLTRFGGAGKDGKRASTWMRVTLGWRKIDGKWKVTHEHVSVPFDMENGQALLDLHP